MISTGGPLYWRFSGQEVRVLPAGCRPLYVAGGVPLLLEHDQHAGPVGHVDDLTINEERVTGALHFRRSCERARWARELLTRPGAGLSVGAYMVPSTVRQERGVTIVAAWELREVSVVGWPRDLGTVLARPPTDASG